MFLSISSGLLLQYSSQNTPKEGESPVPVYRTIFRISGEWWDNGTRKNSNGY